MPKRKAGVPTPSSPHPFPPPHHQTPSHLHWWALLHWTPHISGRGTHPHGRYGGAEGVEQAIERYGDKYRGAGPNKRPALSKALFLHPKYFPPELYSAKQQRHSAHGTGTGKAAAFVMDQSSSKQGAR